MFCHPTMCEPKSTHQRMWSFEAFDQGMVCTWTYIYIYICICICICMYIYIYIYIYIIVFYLLDNDQTSGFKGTNVRNGHGFVAMMSIPWTWLLLMHFLVATPFFLSWISLFFDVISRRCSMIFYGFLEIFDDFLWLLLATRSKTPVW